VSLGKTAARSLAALTPKARQAFLLVSVEDFARSEAAQILEVSQDRIDDLLNEASAEIGRQIATDVLIIEDEPLIAIDLQRLLTDLGHRVASVARSHKEAVKAAASKRPGLVLADIRLEGGSSGLDAVNEMLQMFTVPVVFVTAYPEELMTGRRPEPTFLITKPFRDDAVKAIISQVLFFDQRAQPRRTKPAR
jgi:CheY-like chemotaxis protein